ncbi:hypothetical protein GCM10023215_29030 [Pseudonocardia yuanmonensis]|uniref:UspA domain-containing protein n=1 Tax=Pseudonocardia yuanmonensis TaxID=1095914 RepID=A0ABP8WML1_9PSEU
MRAERIEPLPRRTTDRVDRAAVVLLTVAGLVGALVIGVFALAVHSSGFARADRELSERTQVEATVLTDAPLPVPAAERGAPVTVRVPAAWTAPDGTPRTGTVRVPGRPAAGQSEPIWVDRSGAVVEAPTTRLSAFAIAVFDGAVLLVLLVGALVGARRGIGAVLARVNAAGWEREWAEVEPDWSGRASTGRGPGAGPTRRGPSGVRGRPVAGPSFDRPRRCVCPCRIEDESVRGRGDVVVDSEQGATVQPVVVGVDATRSARDAAAWAAEVAEARGAPLHLLLVGPGTAAPDWLTALAGTLRGQVELVPGGDGPEAVAEALSARAGTAGLLVVGSHGEGSSSGLLAGTVALRLAGASACPVAVVRGSAPDRTPPTAGPVVVGIDGTEAGDDALDLACDLARDLGAPLLVVHAWSDVVAGADGSAHRRREDWSELVAQGEAVAAGARRRVAARVPGVEVETRSVEGTALRTLLDLGESARMVVAAPRSAARTPRPDDGLLLGSTSRGLVGFAPCPVVLTPVRVPSPTR